MMVIILDDPDIPLHFVSGRRRITCCCRTVMPRKKGAAFAHCFLYQVIIVLRNVSKPV